MIGVSEVKQPSCSVASISCSKEHSEEKITGKESVNCAHPFFFLKAQF
jgi:hypothetical protein